MWAINLSARSYEVVEAADGRECLDSIEEEKPEVILLDLAMPVISGWGVLEALKEQSERSRVPVIVVTGWADEEIEIKARRLGAVGVLFKPFGVGELLLAIGQALGEVER